MKYLNKVVIILLNILFCALTIWFFTRNAYLRSYAGFVKEFFLGMLLLITLYINYFLLYPKIYQKHSHNVYWLTLVLIAIATSFIDIAVAYPIIVSCNKEVIQIVGPFNFFSKTLLFIAGRNLALNFFPYLLRERQHYQQALEKEVRVVYQNVRKLDVTDKNSNIHLIDIDKIFYCHQQGNFTEVFSVKNKKYTRLGSMKHLEQLFEEEEFIRITTTVLVPFRYIKSCKDNIVTMRKMPWEEDPTVFKLESKTQEKISERIVEGIKRYQTVDSDKDLPEESIPSKTKRKPATPPEEKLTMVLSYIEKHPNCNTGDIITETKIPLSTVERCLFELKKRGLIKHTGSKKNGGYNVVKAPLDE